MKEYEYITIEETGSSESGKTKQYICRNKKSGADLGLIKWYGPWRQYCFYSDVSIVFSSGCMEDIQGFMEDINFEHKAELVRKRAYKKEKEDA